MHDVQGQGHSGTPQLPALLRPGAYHPHDLGHVPFGLVAPKPRRGKVRAHDTALRFKLGYFLFARFRHVCWVNGLSMAGVLRELIARYCQAMERDDDIT